MGIREEICSKHAKDRDLFLVKYSVEIEWYVQVVKHNQLFLKTPTDSVVPGETVHVVSNEDNLVEHLLGLWHVLKSIEGIRKRVEYLNDKGLAVSMTREVYVNSKIVFRMYVEEHQSLPFISPIVRDSVR